MFQIFPLAVLLHLSFLADAQTAVYSLGNLSQYVTSMNPAPTLTGSQLWYVGGNTPEDGIDVFLSPDLSQSVQTAITSNCTNLTSSGCITGIQALLTNPSVDLEERQLGAALLVISAIIGLFATIAAALSLNGQHPTTVQDYVHFPHDIVDQVSAAQNASVTVIIVDYTQPITISITPSSVITSVTGTQTPAITTYSSAMGGYQQGDVLISLPTDLASRMEEVIHRDIGCDDGSIFNQETTKRCTDFGSVICGAEALILNAAPGYAFGDFRLVDAQAFPFTSTDAVRAMKVAAVFARSYAQDLQLDPDVAAQLGIAAFAIAWEVLYEGQSLGATNIIPGTVLSGTITTLPATATSTSSCSACFASCTMVGAIIDCQTTCSSQSTCTSSTNNGNSTGNGISTTAYEPFIVSEFFSTTLAANTSTNSTTTLTSTPILTFYTTLPVNTNPTTTTTTTTLILPQPTLGALSCSDPVGVGPHDSVDWDDQQQYIDQPCGPGKIFDSTTPRIDFLPVSRTGSRIPYNYYISWLPGCQTTSPNQSSLTPLSNDQSVQCSQLLREDYTNCNNGGAGGWIVAGCLRYEFRANPLPDPPF